MEHQATTEASTAGGGKHSELKRRKRRRMRVLALAAVIVAAGGYYWYQSREVAAGDEPLIVAVEIGDIENTIASAGALQPSKVVDVGAQVSGQLQRLHVEAGDLVEQGQLLAEIDARVQADRVEGSRANIEGLYAQIESRQAALDLAKSNLERQEALRAQNASSQLDYDSALNNLKSAQASMTQLRQQIIQSEANLRMDETQLEYTNIFAPISGTVVSVEMEEGVTLNANQSAPLILRIADLTKMEVETQISEADIGRIKVGMDVYFTTLGGGERRWYSTLRQILPEPLVENNVVLYTGIFEVDNSDGALLSGMTTQVYFVTSAAHDVLRVPLGALTYPEAMSREDMAARMAARRSAGAAAGGGASAGGAGGGSPRGNGPPNFPSGFRPDGAGNGGFPSGNGGFPSGFGGANGGGAAAFAARMSGGEGSQGPRPAIVKVVANDGTISERQIVVGVTDRVNAEVIEGLSAGERVVAGIVQADVPEETNNNNNDRGWRGGPGGFRF